MVIGERKKEPLLTSLVRCDSPVGERSFAVLDVLLEMIDEAGLVDGFSEVVEFAIDQPHGFGAENTGYGGEALFHGPVRSS